MQPAPGEGDPGLDRVKASFRYCAGCTLFVGRSCCWNPDTLSCIVDAPSRSATTALAIGGMSGGGGNQPLARDALAELAASLDALGMLKELASPILRAEGDGESRDQAWEDAWLATGWAITKVETSRDAAAKSIWRSSAQPGTAVRELDIRLQQLDEDYGRARTMIEARLREFGRSLKARRRRTPRPGRLVPAMFRRPVSGRLGAGVLAAFAVVSFGAAALLQLGYLNPFASEGNAMATGPEGAVLGGAGGPQPTGTVIPSPTSAEPKAVIARLDFDELRIGPLAGASREIGWVAGGAEVVAFPSPFDRSIRVEGEGSHRFCVPLQRLHDGGTSFDVDVYGETRLTSGRLTLSMASPGSHATAARVPLELFRGFRLETWHRLRAVWSPGQPVAITIGDTSADPIQRAELPQARDAWAAERSVCVDVAGMAPDAVLLLDNLRVEQ
jgi:hypothetical protein